MFEDNYLPPFPMRNAHAATILPALFRKVNFPMHREKFLLPDGDFLELDFAEQKSAKLSIVLHGLESDSRVAYMRGMSKKLFEAGFDVIAVNFRGCGEEDNRFFHAYHSGFTQDLRTIVNFFAEKKLYREIFLVGFSMGGNILLKYLGEECENVSPKIKKAFAVSVPLDLAACVKKLSEPQNGIYEKRFLRRLRTKLLKKAEKYPALLTQTQVRNMRSFFDVDEYYTARAHGFASASDYWEKSSSARFLPDIKIPTLLLNALDDPFLPDACYPEIQTGFVRAFYTRFGGHVGFANDLRLQNFFHEEIALRLTI